MRNALLALLFLLVLPLSAFAADAEEAAVRAAIDHYLQGHITGDGAHFQLAFHPESKLLFMREGKFTTWTRDEFIERAAPGKPAADEAQRKRRIDFIDVTGDAAVVKLTLEYPAVTFTDYMSLLKVDGEWKIVNKTYHAARKKK